MTGGLERIEKAHPSEATVRMPQRGFIQSQRNSEAVVAGNLPHLEIGSGGFNFWPTVSDDLLPFARPGATSRLSLENAERANGQAKRGA